MSSLRFRPNPRLVDELGNDATMRRWLLARGIDVRKGIRGNLPSGASGGKRVAPFAGRLAFAELEGAGRDVRVQVGTRWRLGHLIEFGSVHNPAYAPVRKTVRQLGYRFEEGR